MRLPKYKVLTSKTCEEINGAELPEEKYNTEIDALVSEINELLRKEFGNHEFYKVHWFDSLYGNDSVRYFSFDLKYGEMQHELIQMLAVKSWVELVRYENGNVGFVAEYNGELNGLEIEKCTEREWEES